MTLLKIPPLLFVCLKGGLGNQLFILFFALFLKQNFPNCIVVCSDLNFYLSDKYKRTLLVDKCFQDLDIHYISMRGASGALTTLALKILRKLATLFSRNLYTPFFGYFADDLVVKSGLQIHAISIPLLSIFSGYWQDSSYPLSLNRNSISRVSKNLFTSQGLSATLDNTLAVHIRDQNYDHTLSFEYYHKSFDIIKSKSCIDNCIIYCEAITPFVLRIKSMITESGYKCGIDHASDPIDSLCKMSISGALITANSTFSWMAAFFMSKLNPSFLVCLPANYHISSNTSFCLPNAIIVES